MTNDIFSVSIRVYYEDTDAGGVVYYANYLKFMERARTEWLRSLGFGQHRLAAEENVVFVVQSLEASFVAPARLDDLLQVSVRPVLCRRSSFECMQAVVDARVPDRTLCHGRVRVACLRRADFRPVAMPKALLEELSNVC
jgi:acyl-CoA thioester hydrolase